MEHTGFPSDETLAAFLDGKLDPDTRRRVVEHMTTCDECYATVTGGGTITGSQAEAPQNVRSRLRKYSMFGSLAAAATLLFTVGPALWNSQYVFEARLNAALPATRKVEARLSTVPYRPLAPNYRGKATNNDLQLKDIRLLVLLARLEETASHKSTEENYHRLGLAHLLVGHWDDAVKALLFSLRLETGSADPETAIHLSKDVRLLDDLAAAMCSRGVERRNSNDLSMALTITDRVQTLSHADASNAFNRALILERLQHRQEAIQAWKELLKLDSTSSWSTEARAHLKDLALDVSTGGVLNRLEIAVARDRIMREILPAWASLRRLGHGRKAVIALLPANQLLVDIPALRFELEGRALREVETSETTNAKRRLRTLSSAHELIARAASAYRDLRIEEAERDYKDSERLFTMVSSPCVRLAQMGQASCAFYRNDYRAARLLAMRVLSTSEPGEHLVRGQALWLEGICDLALTMPYEALDAYDDSLHEFTCAGDLSAQAAVETLIAEASEYLGDEERADKQRRLAMMHADQGAAPRRLQLVLSEAATSAIKQGHTSEARLLVARLRRVSDELADPSMIVDARIVAGRLCMADHDAICAEHAMREARDELTHIREESLRMRSSAQIAIGFRVLGADLDSAVDFFVKTRNNFGLTEALAHRASRYRLAGNMGRARADLERAVAVERAEQPWRSSLPEKRQGAVDDLIDLLCSRSECLTAFWYADSEHGVISHPPPAHRSIISPRNTAFIEYIITEHGVYAWTLRGAKLTAFTLNVAPIYLNARIASFAKAAVDRRPDLRPALRWLYQALVAPLEGELAMCDNIVIAPDRSLRAIPFAALIDSGGKYLLQRATIAEVPSLSETLAVAQNSEIPSTALLVAGAGDDFNRTLTNAEPEVNEIGKFYARSTVFTQGESVSAFLDAALGADVIHIAAHHESNLEHPEAAAFLFGRTRSSGSTEVLYAWQVAKLKLKRRPIVVLAGCATAVGQEARSDPSGMAGAFISAGASSIVATLWPVADASAARMAVNIHRRIARGAPAAVALRDEQLRILHDGSALERDPWTWAGYSVTLGWAPFQVGTQSSS